MKGRVTLKDVAREVGTSVAAVSVTLSGKFNGSMRVSEATRKRIIDAAAALGYVPNPIAQSLSTGRSGVLGLVFPYVDAFIDRNPFCSMVMNGVFAEAIEDSYNMMLYTVKDAAGSPGHTIDPRMDGLVMAVPPEDDPMLAECAERQFPCVAVVSPQRKDSVMTVNADDFNGGLLATKHLLSLGHRKVMMLHGGSGVSTNTPRMEGYYAALAEAGLEAPDDMIVQAGFDWKPAFEAMNKVLDRPKSLWPTAIFAVNDLCAAGAMKAIKSRGLRIPEDIAIVGFDDTWFATSIHPHLTTVRMPIQEMGAKAVRMLAAEVAGRPPQERNVVLDVSLTVRSSCGASLMATTEPSLY